ncbi:EboA domain-containing protein [Marinoscillum pacificum]|uniref:EboA domain-containing protein n=1 Tax=Marinoscillum pacificum TaxID=392723 RepID=UPI00215821DA|nr:EboA domain-containing protein [Marinoscillum pacificum]
MTTTSEYLHQFISKQLSPQANEWFEKKYAEVQSSDTSRAFFLAFGMTPKKIGTEKLHVDENSLTELLKSYPGFNPIYWSIDQLCRVRLMSAISTEYNHQWITQLFSTADMNEQVALYKGLFFLENVKDFTEQAVEGVRTNMQPVFDAIALNNPFAETYFSEGAWNQVVLKAIFMNRPIYRIVGLEERNNENLTSTLIDFAHERWAAGRQVVPELWRLAKERFDSDLLKEIIEKFKTFDSLEQEAIALMIQETELAEAKDWAAQNNITTNKSWDELGQALENQN